MATAVSSGIACGTVRHALAAGGRPALSRGRARSGLTVNRTDGKSPSGTDDRDTGGPKMNARRGAASRASNGGPAPAPSYWRARLQGKAGCIWMCRADGSAPCRHWRCQMSGSIHRGLRACAAGAIGLIVVAACASAPAGTLQGAGPLKTEVRPVADFTGVEARHGMKLNLVIGTPPKVELTAQENLLSISTTNVANGTLIIDTTRNWSSLDGITVKVTMPTIAALGLVGGATGLANALTATDLSIHTEGGAVLEMSGSVESLDVTSNGGGVLKLGALATRNATVDLEGGVVATLDVTGTVSGSASGGVLLVVRGHPSSVDVSTTGGAVVTQE